MTPGGVAVPRTDDRNPNIMMQPARAFALCLATFFPATAGQAHSEKKATTPADGVVLTGAPDTIGMTFDMPMRVTMVRLTGADGVEIALERSDGMAPVSEFTATPVAIGPGDYTVEWRGLAGDGHAMQGSFSFRVVD